MGQILNKLLNLLKMPLGRLEDGYGRRTKRRVRVRETVSLGERRFLAVVEYGQHEILVGGTASSISVLMTSPGLDGGIPAAEGHLSQGALQWREA